ncbi:MAG TPA: hypothetical protein VI423_03090 [Paenisporosarcina sp.]|nr:hypothetical protein [Paenisporosarcina sp.]
MTTRQQKRIVWLLLIEKLERLEAQHYAIDERTHCGGCDICTQIRAIGKQLAPEKEIGTRTSRVLAKIDYHMTPEVYRTLKAGGQVDTQIAKACKVSPKSLQNWKIHNGLNGERSATRRDKK